VRHSASIWTVVAACVVLGVAASARSHDQAKPATGQSKSAPVTTLSGIYTPAQAAKGQDIYFALCVSCHPRGTYAGPGFKTNWGGKPLSELFDWVLTKMPKNDPGILSEDESAQVVAFILKENQMPAGKAPLPADFNALGRIRIQLK
jgi:mono/diheme cytochrome c family protein